MEMQTILFFSALCSLAFLIGRFVESRENSAQKTVGSITGSLKELVKELKEEPEVENEFELKEVFVDRFKQLDILADEAKSLAKKMENERESLWEDVRKDYEIGDKNLSVSDDFRTLKVIKPTKLETFIASRLKR